MKERKQKAKKDPKNDNRKRFMITCEVLTDTRNKKFNFGLLYKCQAHEGNFQKRGDIRGNATELNEYKQVRFARAPNNFFFTGKVHFFVHWNNEKRSKNAVCAKLSHIAKIVHLRGF